MASFVACQCILDWEDIAKVLFLTLQPTNHGLSPHKSKTTNQRQRTIYVSE